MKIEKLKQNFAAKFTGETLDQIFSVIDETANDIGEGLMFGCHSMKELSERFYECFGVTVKKVTARRDTEQSNIFRLFCHVLNRAGYTQNQITNFTDHKNHTSILYHIHLYNDLLKIHDDLAENTLNRWVQFNSRLRAAA